MWQKSSLLACILFFSVNCWGQYGGYCLIESARNYDYASAGNLYNLNGFISLNSCTSESWAKGRQYYGSSNTDYSSESPNTVWCQAKIINNLPFPFFGTTTVCAYVIYKDLNLKGVRVSKGERYKELVAYKEYKNPFPFTVYVGFTDISPWYFFQTGDGFKVRWEVEWNGELQASLESDWYCLVKEAEPDVTPTVLPFPTAVRTATPAPTATPTPTVTQTSIPVWTPAETLFSTPTSLFSPVNTPTVTPVNTSTPGALSYQLIKVVIANDSDEAQIQPFVSISQLSQFSVNPNWAGEYLSDGMFDLCEVNGFYRVFTGTEVSYSNQTDEKQNLYFNVSCLVDGEWKSQYLELFYSIPPGQSYSSWKGLVFIFPDTPVFTGKSIKFRWEIKEYGMIPVTKDSYSVILKK